ncbi:MAG: hypothetical protein PHW73_09120 [Atribacterota bacterium]|nr:hypothetical protein [Atribacterota bacterium]
MKNNWFKVMTIILLLWALADHSYGYYQPLRWTVLIVGAYSAYLAYKLENKGWTWAFGIIAMLFNPIIPFTFQRETWQFIDVVAAIIFLVSLFKLRIKERTEKPTEK